MERSGSKAEEIEDEKSKVSIYPSLSGLSNGKNNDRIRYMKDKESQLLLKLEHYDKLRKRWGIVKNVTQGIGIFLTVSLGALTIVISSGALAIPVVGTVLTSTGVFSTSLMTMVDKSLMSKKRKSLSKKHLHIKEVYDKLHYYFQKVTDDNVITLEEIETFDKIAQEGNKIHVSKKIQHDSVFLDELKTLVKTLETLGVNGKT